MSFLRNLKGDEVDALTIEDIKHLDDKGYVVKENFFSKMDAHNLSHHIRRLLSLISTPEAKEKLKNHMWTKPSERKGHMGIYFFIIDNHEFGRVCFDDQLAHPAYLSTVPQEQINKSNVTFVEKRGGRGWDVGQYRITYPTGDWSQKDKFNGLRIPEAGPIIELLNNFYEDEYYLSSIQVLVSDSLENTMHLHRDTTETAGQNKKMKAFIYLTHVNDPHDGPYSYVEGTHKDYNLKESDGQTIAFLGSAGTLILSNQNGLHRGQPQKQGRSRIMFVLNLFQKDRDSS